MEFTGSDLHILKYLALYGKNLSLQQLERKYALRGGDSSHFILSSTSLTSNAPQKWNLSMPHDSLIWSYVHYLETKGIEDVFATAKKDIALPEQRTVCLSVSANKCSVQAIAGGDETIKAQFPN